MLADVLALWSDWPVFPTLHGGDQTNVAGVREQLRERGFDGEAREDEDVPATKGELVVKTFDGNGNYYLQWREGDRVQSR